MAKVNLHWQLTNRCFVSVPISFIIAWRLRAEGSEAPQQSWHFRWGGLLGGAGGVTASACAGALRAQGRLLEPKYWRCPVKYLGVIPFSVLSVCSHTESRGPFSNPNAQWIVFDQSWTCVAVVLRPSSAEDAKTTLSGNLVFCNISSAS